MRYRKVLWTYIERNTITNNNADSSVVLVQIGKVLVAVSVDQKGRNVGLGRELELIGIDRRD